MKCPECGNEDAYIGLSEVECRNSRCKFYVEVKIFEKDKEDETKDVEPIDKDHD